MYVYIYREREIERERKASSSSRGRRTRSPGARRCGYRCRRGANGVSTNGVTANVMFLFDRGLPLTYFCLPKNTSAYLFPQSEKNMFAATPSVLTPFVRNQMWTFKSQ